MRALESPDPDEIGPYRVVAELGRGGMGRVLLGTSPDGRLVAVKLVHARFAADDGFRARFRREVSASRKVSGAFTAAVLDADADAETPWFASAFVAGPSLATAVRTAGVLPEEAVRRLAAGLATALVEIHRVGLIHRDLKPANVLLAEDGARVIDFGIARAAEGEEQTELTRTGLVIGSPGFMSPEQADDRELAPASDVFALGVVLVMALTGKSPFTGPSVPQTLFNVVHGEPDLSAVPPSLLPIVGPCLDKDPDARPTPARLLGRVGPIAPARRQWPDAVHQLIAAQRADIDRLLGDADRTIARRPARAEPVQAPTRLTPTIEARPASRRAPAVIAAVTALPVAILLGAGVYLSRPDGEPAAAETPRGRPATSAATPTTPGTPDKYVKMPICSEAAGKLPLPPRNKKLDNYNENSESATAGCGWGEQFTRRAGVSWDLKRSIANENGTAEQEKAFAKNAADETPAPGLGFGDEAFWDKPDPASPAASNAWTCELTVRDGNLIVSVGRGKEETAANCRAEAIRIARAMIRAMPD